MGITLRTGSNFILPYDFWSCALKTLAAKFHNGFVKIPSSIVEFSSLTSLKLHSFEINDSFGKWISSYFKHLGKLELKRFRGEKLMDITSSSLKQSEISSTDELLHLQVFVEILEVMVLRWRFDSLDDE